MIKVWQVSIAAVWISGCSMSMENVLPEQFNAPMAKTYDAIFREGTGYRKVEGVRRQQEETATVTIQRVAVRSERPSATGGAQPLCNPEITFRVRAHLTESEQAVVPTYSSKILMYEKAHWALPGEESIGC